MKPILLILCCGLLALPVTSFSANISPQTLSFSITAPVVSAPTATKEHTGFFARVKNHLGHAIGKVKKFFQEGRPKLLAGPFLLGLLLGPLAFLFFIGNKKRDFRYSVKVGFVTFLFVALGALIVLLLI